MKHKLNKQLVERLWHLAIPVTVAGGGIIVALVVWHLMVLAEQRVLHADFNDRSGNQATLLQERISDYFDIMRALGALFDTSPEKIPRGTFEDFANQLLKDHHAILNIGWLPRVKREERAGHEQDGARDGLQGYHIRLAADIAADGALPIAPERDEYFPKFYSTEPKATRVYGLDLYGHPEMRPMLDRARDTGELSVSAPVMLYIGQGDRRGIVAALPIYARGRPHESVEERRRNLIGFIQGVFQFHVMIEKSFAPIVSPMHISLFPPGIQPNDLPVHSSSLFHSHAASEALPWSTLVAGLHRSFPIKFGDVVWTLIVTPEIEDYLSAGLRQSTVVLICGLLLTAGLVLLVTMTNRYAGTIERQSLRFGAALDNMAQGLCMFDAERRLVVTNPRFADIFNIAADSIRPSMPMDELMMLVRPSHLDAESTIRIQNEFLAHPQFGTKVTTLRDGRIISISHRPMRNGGFVATFDDITEQRQAEERIRHMAGHDPLTDLPNRVTFYERMEAVLRAVGRSGPAAILSLDLDHFKTVNDTMGHPVGDQLLQMAADRMRCCSREGDLVARLGGDEFAIICTPAGQSSDVGAFAARLIDVVGEAYTIEGRQVVVGVSIGIALAPADGNDPDVLMKNADLALYRAKAEGRGSYRFFETEMDARMQKRRSLELDLRKAVVNGEFAVHYQPIVDVKTGRITACEALIRWHHPERGMVSPLEFIPIAEETGLIMPIGEWVLRRACSDAVSWPQDVTVAVNVSPAQFRTGHFARAVAESLRVACLPASRLELEITELVLMQDNSAALPMLKEIRDLGVTIAMDDFGTGYSSIGYLRSFPFNKIKIDQSFIRDLAKKNDSLAILRAVVGLGRSLGMATIAEGVETRDQFEVLLREGCTEAQGYLFSEPRLASEITKLLQPVNGRQRHSVRASEQTVLVH